jgi:hypothetical protein
MKKRIRKDGKERDENSQNVLAGIALPDFVLNNFSSKLGKEIIENNREPTDTEVKQLRENIASMFTAASVQLAESPAEQQEVMTYLARSRRHVEGKDGKVSQDKFLSAEEDLNKAIVIFRRKLRELKSIQQMVFIVIGTAIAYLLIVIVMGVAQNRNQDITILGIPILVLIWGCIGGIAAILFRHRSTIEEKWPFELRWLWVVIRPLLGMIMGGFMYLCVLSGLFIFGGPIRQGPAQQQLFWALAFVAGFSDKLWEFLVDRVLALYSSKEHESI